MSGKWGYTLSTSGTNITSPQSVEYLSVQSRRGRAYLERSLGKTDVASLEIGSGSTIQDDILPLNLFLMPTRLDAELTYYNMTLQKGNFRVQSYLNRTDFTLSGRQGFPFYGDLDNRLWHNSVEFTAPLGARQTLVAGAVYSDDSWRVNFTQYEKQNVELYSFYLQDAINLTSQLALTLGGRVDYKPLTSTETPLRAALVYAPSPAHSFRVTAAQGFRAPTLVEYFVIAPLPPMTVYGQTDLRPEKGQSLELGYRGLWANDRLFVGLDFYRERMEDFINFQQTDPATIVFANGGKSTNTGGELELRLLLSSTSRLQFSCAYQEIEDEGAIVDFADSAPNSKASLAFLHTPLQGWFFNSWLCYSDQTTWNLATPGQFPSLATSPSYISANVYAGYTFSPKIRLGVSILNVFNEASAQFPYGERLKRAVSAGLEASL